MNITDYQCQIKIIRQDDPRFDISDGFVTSPRAGFEISYGCPVEYKMVLQECINNGWLKPVAYMTERELLFSGLGPNLG
jgi:hypothetical protein